MARKITRKLPYLLGFLIAVGPVSVDMYLPAFPAIARELHGAAPQYSLAAYFLGLGFGQITQGALSDRWGRRAPLLAGLVLYTLASAGCGLSWNIASLVAFRFLTALGASAGVVIPRAMVRDQVDGVAAAQMFSQLMLVMGVAPILAPMAGSLILQIWPWRMIFFVCAAYGVAAFCVVWFWVPDTLAPAARTRLGLAAQLARYGMILRDRVFLTHALALTCTSACLFAYLAGTPQIFIGIYHWSSAGYAALFGLNALVYIGFNQINPALVRRFGITPIITYSGRVLLLASLCLALLAWHPLGAFAIMAALLACETGFGFVTPCATVGALTHHQAHAGSASALLGTLQYAGGAVAGLAVGALADGTARPMAFTMLAMSLGGVLAASLRPALDFPSPER